ncbi:hypothetical protein Y032_0739g1961 [Ancylostoma ceylanicum]|uniref:Uncharacterized protein n=1 Tax=Ancylostoma ceylanicum TaxID=53326 RepID=A0A016WFU8_9BILA|nr:hypothetical protein Y032_0739g1961 [Ancylostoma ceylanicum]
MSPSGSFSDSQCIVAVTSSSYYQKSKSLFAGTIIQAPMCTLKISDVQIIVDHEITPMDTFYHAGTECKKNRTPTDTFYHAGTKCKKNR